MNHVQIVFKDGKTGEIKLIPENMDDIWHLYNIILPGDLVRALTFRTDEQVTGDQKRSKKAEKKRMKLGVRVEKIEFHNFSDRLRIHGTIEEGPQDLGSYHTLNIEADPTSPTNKVSIIKELWPAHDLERLNEAVQQSKQPLVIFVSLDEDEGTVAILRQSGIQKIANVDSQRSGKQYEGMPAQKDFFGELFSLVQQNVAPQTPIAIVGPGFTREHFIQQGNERFPDVFKHCTSYGTGHAGMNGIHEAIKAGVVDQITKENRVSYETQLVERFFEEIQKNGLVTYGPDAVRTALMQGAVEHLLIIDTLVRTQSGERLLKQAQETQSNFTIINSLHDAGKKFEGIGGIGAFLRFKMQEQ